MFSTGTVRVYTYIYGRRRANNGTRPAAANRHTLGNGKPTTTQGQLRQTDTDLCILTEWNCSWIYSGVVDFGFWCLKLFKLKDLRILLCCDVELQSFVCLNVVNKLSIEPTICSGARVSHCFIRYKKIFCTRHCTTNLQLELGARLTRGRCHNREPLSPLGARLTRGRCHNREPLFSPWVAKATIKKPLSPVWIWSCAYYYIIVFAILYIYIFIYGQRRANNCTRPTAASRHTTSGGKPTNPNYYHD